MKTQDGFLRGEDGSNVELLLSWLTSMEAVKFKQLLDSQLKRWRFRKLPGDAKVIGAVEATCQKLFPELTVTVLPKGMRLDSFGTRGRVWYSGEEFQALLSRKPESHEDYILSKFVYGGASRNPGLEVRYLGGPSRVGRVRSIQPWGMKVDTPQGVRNIRWDRITAARVLMSDERMPPRRLEFLSIDGTVQSSWAYDYFGDSDDPLERYR